MLKLNKKIILASQSPRRHFLLKELGFDFEIVSKDIPEDFPADLKREEIPLYLCQLKAKAFESELLSDSLLITADTIVWINDRVLNKPKDKNDAIKMLQMLSGAMHEVITAVCLKTKEKAITFFDLTQVYFKKLSMEEIEFYIDNFQPYDKAGAYGAQEWIGYVGIEKIEGSYFNVMGLPIQKLYEKLNQF